MAFSAPRGASMLFEISNEQTEALRELLAAVKDYRTKAALEGSAHETLRLNQAMKRVEEMFSIVLA
jgi:hypothetical protein